MGRFADALKLSVDLHAERGVDLYADPEFRRAAAAHVHPEFECTAPGVQTSSYRGLDGLEQMQRDYAEAWGEIEYTIEELIETDTGVFAAVRYRGVGRGSGVEVEQTHFWAQAYRDGKLHRFVIVTEREEAERVVGE